MNSQQLIQFFGNTAAHIVVSEGIPNGAPFTAHQLKLIDRAWRELYMDSLLTAPCEHPTGKRISGRYCEDCGRNVPETVEAT